MTRPNDAATARPYSRDAHSGDRPESHWATDGLTKREHFAALALQGLCASFTPGHVDPKNPARIAVALADALVEALNQTSP